MNSKELVKVTEASPFTIKGSFSTDLMKNKLWLCSELAKLKNNFSNIYVLGSWYGNISFVLDNLDHFSFDKITNIDIEDKWTQTGIKLADKLGISKKVKYLCKDANAINYKCNQDSLIVNNSCNDIERDQWFENIPKGTWVALQGRNNLPKANREFSSLNKFINTYKLNDIKFSGEKTFTDPETKYTLFMIIGKK